MIGTHAGILALVLSAASATLDVAVDRVEMCTVEDVRALRLAVMGPQARAERAEPGLPLGTAPVDGAELKADIQVQRARADAPPPPPITPAWGQGPR